MPSPIFLSACQATLHSRPANHSICEIAIPDFLYRIAGGRDPISRSISAYAGNTSCLSGRNTTSSRQSFLEGSLCSIQTHREVYSFPATLEFRAPYRHPKERILLHA